LKMAFGTQGARGASFFSEDTTLSNLHALSELKNQSQPPISLGSMMQQVSTVALADQTIANANITLMNGTATLMGPVNAVLSGAASFFSGTAGFTKDHPVAGAALDFGMLFGAAVAGMGAWSGAKGAAGMVEKAAIGLSKYIATATGGVIARAFGVVTIEELGLGALAAVGGQIVLGAAIAGGIAYALAAGLKWAMDKIPTAAPPPGWTPKGIDPNAAHGVTTGHPSYARMPPQAAPVIHNHVYVDGREVAATLIPPNTLGPSGFNQSSTPLRPAMSSSN
jgi:hypothetical protein